jgi:hypothetical protein
VGFLEKRKGDGGLRSLLFTLRHCTVQTRTIALRKGQKQTAIDR